ncbi:hypothetical protein J437_LFUL008908 [Ladona fulva]|uniref:DDE Tnp4 domain-containing protein n=1 Tax=Ladona fulva TaxID=123851 RepID=A0A8K0K5C7_LADFU|nr:hypothetical protein J437_LFUL008908 [Ladona fulva]
MDAVHLLRCIRRYRRKRHLKVLSDMRFHMRHLRDTSNPFEASDVVFQGLYRLTKDLARAAIEELRPLLAVGQRVTHIPIEIKVLCALHFYGQGSYQRSLRSDSQVPLSQPSVSRAIKEVTEGLNSPQILGKWIVFPQGKNGRTEAIQKNYQATGIPGVLGYVAGTHVSIKAPREEEHLYFNTKNYHSIHPQIVCDSDLKITNVLSRYPGSADVSYVWANSGVRQRVMDIWARGERCWLLGDSDYPHEPWLQTPILSAEEGTLEAQYTQYHIKARSAVERCIGLLKGRFRCLLLAQKLEYQPRKACLFTNACCVLHNMCVLGGVPYVEDEVHLDDGKDVVPVQQGDRAMLDEARAVQEKTAKVVIALFVPFVVPVTALIISCVSLVETPIISMADGTLSVASAILSLALISLLQTHIIHALK